MRNLLPLLIILACPLMMIFMMRGMHGGGTTKSGHGTQDDETRSYDGQASDERIAELERDVASLRAESGAPTIHRRVDRP